MHNWLILIYKIPPKPTSTRVYVWRKLKKLGSILLHDAAWILPSNSRTWEQFQWLASEIIELGGEATLWESESALFGQEEAIIQQFVAQVEPDYEDIIQELKQTDPDLVILSRKYQQLQLQDYFKCELGQIVREALLTARGGENE
ncbi:MULTISPECIES: Chromate resistance protein ChrB [unclassified Paenibacillus]|uniref:Chromate resistance protein ChrB n=1 Tax=unclassified Paenibacillus TaxID=185978 RepID=UPI0036456115